MPSVAISGGALDYTVAGSGPPLCLTHQYTSVAATDPLAAAFMPFFTCYAFNARGIGGSGPVRGPADLTMTALADDLAAARLALGLAPWVVVGASTGGMVALLHALAHPAAVAALALVDTAASHRYVEGSLYDATGPYAAQMAEANRAMAAGTPEGMAEWARIVWRLSLADPTHSPPPTGPRPQFTGERMRAFIGALPGFDVAAQLSSIAVPTLVLVGRHDPQCPLANSERIAATIPHARLAVFEHSGHFPYLEEPDRFRDAVRAWVRDARNSRRAIPYNAAQP